MIINNKSRTLWIGAEEDQARRRIELEETYLQLDTPTVTTKQIQPTTKRSRETYTSNNQQNDWDRYRTLKLRTHRPQVGRPTRLPRRQPLQPVPQENPTQHSSIEFDYTCNKQREPDATISDKSTTPVNKEYIKTINIYHPLPNPKPAINETAEC